MMLWFFLAATNTAAATLAVTLSSRGAVADGRVVTVSAPVEAKREVEDANPGLPSACYHDAEEPIDDAAALLDGWLGSHIERSIP